MLIAFLIWLIIVIVIGAIVFWIIKAIGLPQPWEKIVFAILGLIFLLLLLAQLGLVGSVRPFHYPIS